MDGEELSHPSVIVVSGWACGGGEGRVGSGRDLRKREGQKVENLDSRPIVRQVSDDCHADKPQFQRMLALETSGQDMMFPSTEVSASSRTR
jgi:hypothetical protein